MYPITHFLFAFLIGGVLVELGFWGGGMVWVIGLIAVFIDIDHLISYGILHRDFNPQHAWNGAVVKHEHERTFIHHRLGFVLITILIAGIYFISFDWFLILAIGYYSHMFLDYAHLNIFGVRGDFCEDVEGFVMKIPKYEGVIEVLLAVGVVWLLVG